MKRRSAWILGMALVAVAGVAFGASRGRRVVVDQPVYVDGTLNYEWHGDHSRGCDRHNLCHEHGSIVVRFLGFGDLTTRGTHGDVTLEGATGTARVIRDDPAAATGECVDVVNAVELPISLTRVGGSRYRATIGTGSISSGRCAGPLAPELTGLRLAARRLPTHRTGFDLRTTTRFAGGPFSGRLTSTVQLYPDTADGGPTSYTDTSGASPPSHPSRTQLVEFVRLRYRVTDAGGALTTSFTSAPPPACIPVDGCGLAGSVRIALRPFRGTLSIIARRVVRRRVSARRALADLLKGDLHAAPTDAGLPDARAIVTETATRDGAPGCRDAISAALPLGVLSAGGRLPRFALSLSSPLFGADVLRTHCPGPNSADVFANGVAELYGDPLSVALADVHLRSLERRRAAVFALKDPGRFRSAAYSGVRGGALVFHLSWVERRAGTVTERVGG